jgi:hypothetical protein
MTKSSSNALKKNYSLKEATYLHLAGQMFYIYGGIDVGDAT